MSEIIFRASDDPEELLESMFDRIELWSVPYVPFSDQSGLVTIPLQQRCDRRMIRGEADLGVSIAEWLLQSDAQPMLIPSGKECDARWRADVTVRIAVG